MQINLIRERINAWLVQFLLSSSSWVFTEAMELDWVVKEVIIIILQEMYNGRSLTRAKTRPDYTTCL